MGSRILVNNFPNINLLKQQEEKLRNVDAKKAAQVERLGMGASSSKGGIGHSVLNQMNTIVQV